MKQRIGIIFGGPSSEKEVSLEGGRYVYQRLDRERFGAVALFIDSRYACWVISEKLIIQNTTGDLEKLLANEAQKISYEQLPSLIDFAFIVGHGKYMEDGCLQGLLEIIDVPYNGPGVLGAALGADKWVSRQILHGAGIKTPDSVPIIEDEWLNSRDLVMAAIEKTIGFPTVIKPAREGCSTAITIANGKSQLSAGIDAALVWDRMVLAEKLIHGTEVTVSVVGNEDKEVLPITETPRQRGKDYLTLEDKFLPGGAEMITPARLSPELTVKVQAVAKQAAEELGMVGYPRFDMFVANNEAIILEANTLPGITPSTMIFHQAAEVGLTPSAYVTKIIELGLEAYKNKRGPL